MQVVLGILLTIGKVLLVILLIILLLLALILFVPIRYRIEGGGEQSNLRGEGELSWLLHLLSLRIRFRKDETKELEKDVSLRICGIDPKEVKRKRAEGKRARAKAAKKQKIEEIKKEDPAKYEELKEEARLRREAREAEARKRREEEERLQAEQKAREAREAEEAEKAEQARRTRTRTEKLAQLIRRMRLLLRKLLQKGALLMERGMSGFSALFQRLHQLFLVPAVVVDAIFKMLSKIQGICDTMSEILEFATDPRTKSAIKAVKMRLGKVLKHLLPRSLKGDVTFGLEDPGSTGEVLAAVSMLYPLYGGKVSLNPDFTEKRLEGELTAAGRIRLGYLLVQVVLVVLRRDVRFVWKTYKGFKSKQQSDDEVYEMEEAS